MRHLQISSFLRGRRPIALVVGLVGLGAIAACGTKPSGPSSPDVWATVDGREIHRADVEKAYRRVARPDQRPSEEEALTLKLSLLNELVVQDILVARARALQIDVSAADVDAAFRERRQNLTDEAFEREMAQRGLTADDMKAGLRLELIADKVIDREVVSKIAVTDKEVSDFYEANRQQFNLPERSYRIAQIVVTPGRDGNVNNRQNDDAATPQAAASKAAMIMDRLRAGASFAELAMDYSEDPETAPNGGDLGFVPESALKQVPPALRDAVLKSVPGNVSQVSAGGAHTIVLLIAREEAGQRDLTMPAVRDTITNTLRDRKLQLLRTAYLTVARAEAVVVNYLAKRIVESQGAMPALGPIAPGR